MVTVLLLAGVYAVRLGYHLLIAQRTRSRGGGVGLSVSQSECPGSRATEQIFIKFRTGGLRLMLILNIT